MGCPDIHTLEKFGFGWIAATDQPDIREHVQSCSECRDKLGGITDIVRSIRAILSEMRADGGNGRHPRSGV